MTSLAAPARRAAPLTRRQVLLLAAGAAAAGAAAGLAGPLAGMALLAGLAGLVLIRLRRWPMALVLLLLAWLPVQNLAIALLMDAGELRPAAAQAVTVFKEAAVVGLLGLLVVTGRAWRWRFTEVTFAAYLLWVASYLPRGDLPLVAQLAGLRMLAIPVLLYLVGRYLPASRAAPRQVLLTVVAALTIVAVWGWVEWLALDTGLLARWQTANAAAKGQQVGRVDDLLEGAFYTAIGSAASGDIVWVRRMIATYLEPLTLGHALILPVTFLFCALVSGPLRPVRPRWLAAGLLMLLGLTQGMSFSRGALLASGAAVALIALAHRRARWPAALLLALALGLALAAPRTRTFIFNTLRFEDPSTIAHSNQLAAGWTFARQQPLGLGLGHGGYVGAQFAAGQAEGTAESYYFSMISQVGVVGAGLFGLATLSLLAGLAAAARRARGPWARAAALSAGAALAGQSLSAIFSEAAFGMLACAAVWLLAGLVIQHSHASLGQMPVLEPTNNADAQ